MIERERELARCRERHAKRYAEDAEYREKICAYRREWQKRRFAQDPEFRRKMLAAGSAYKKAHRPRINKLRRLKREHSAEYRERERVRNARSHLKFKYGMTWEDYNELLARQGGACAICREKSDKMLCVDHCHETGAVRGLLCPICNSAVGFFRDDPKLTRAATKYLEAFLKTRALHGEQPRSAVSSWPGWSPWALRKGRHCRA